MNAPQKDHIVKLLTGLLAQILQTNPADLDPAERFNRLGLTSKLAVQFIAAAGNELERKLPTTLVWDYPTINQVAGFLVGEKTSTTKVSNRSPRGSVINNEPIAVVGIACRFPKASSPSEFWDLLAAGGSTAKEVSGRYNWRDKLSTDPNEPGKLGSKYACLLEDVYGFDPEFFGLSDEETLQMDPQQRLMCELAWELLADTGTTAEQIRGQRAGVFVSAMWSDYYMLSHRLGDNHINRFTATGSHLSIISNRISYLLGLIGPSITIDTASSSSLVAVHLACRSILSGECDFAMAGGVNLILAADGTISLTKFGAMAPDGKCKSFDARANGYVRGEGAGLVGLKRLSLAQADGDRIYCVIEGSAWNNDGASNGMTAPNPAAQRDVLSVAYADAGVDPARTYYVETHGPGTALGDPIEASALSSVLCQNREHPLRIGSVKTNIGHQEAASGIAGFIKLALCLFHRALPPTINFETPNPRIPFADQQIKVVTELEELPGHGEFFAGINSFGFGGVNCHVVAKTPPQLPQTQHILLKTNNPIAILDELADKVRSNNDSFHHLFNSHVAKLSSAEGNQRVGLFITDASDFNKFISDKQKRTTSSGWYQSSSEIKQEPQNVFVFSGQGSQYKGMVVELLADPTFRFFMEECDLELAKLTGYSVLEKLLDWPDNEPVELIQPMLFSVQYSLAQLWINRGVKPHRVVGHSMGEVAAACIAGKLNLADACSVIWHRSRLLAKTAGQGGMALVGLSEAQLQQHLEIYEKTLSIAAINSPTSTVVSGEKTAIDLFVKQFEDSEVFVRRIKVVNAGHCHLLDPVKSELFTSLEHIKPQAGHLEFTSTVKPKEQNVNTDAAYWVYNLRDSVRFAPAIENIMQGAEDLNFIEISPHPVLLNVLPEMKNFKESYAILATLRRGEAANQVWADSMSALHCRGVDLHGLNIPSLHNFKDSFVGEPFYLPVSGHTANSVREKIANLKTQLSGANIEQVIEYRAKLWETVEHYQHRGFLSVDLQKAELKESPGIECLTRLPELVFNPAINESTSAQIIKRSHRDQKLFPLLTPASGLDFYITALRQIIGNTNVISSKRVEPLVLQPVGVEGSRLSLLDGIESIVIQLWQLGYNVQPNLIRLGARRPVPDYRNHFWQKRQFNLIEQYPRYLKDVVSLEVDTESNISDWREVQLAGRDLTVNTFMCSSKSGLAVLVACAYRIGGESIISLADINFSFHVEEGKYQLQRSQQRLSIFNETSTEVASARLLPSQLFKDTSLKLESTSATTPVIAGLISCSSWEAHQARLLLSPEKDWVQQISEVLELWLTEHHYVPVLLNAASLSVAEPVAARADLDLTIIVTLAGICCEVISEGQKILVMSGILLEDATDPIAKVPELLDTVSTLTSDQTNQLIQLLKNERKVSDG